MKLGLQGMLATTAAAAAILAGAHVARADGMPGGPGPAYAPALWSGAYVGIESGWDWDSVHTTFTDFDTHSHYNRDVLNAGLFVGYQHQFGPLVIGVEASLIGNEFDSMKNAAVVGAGNCPNPSLNCIGRITDVFTVGPRVGWALGNFMPYVTGGFASGSVNFRAVGANGVATEMEDNRQDGYYLGGGLDWKLARHVVVGIEYRHTDLGTGPTEFDFNPATGANVEHVQNRATSDAIMVRGSLLFGGRDYEPLK
jgi:outer membrane immunogenic protein